MSVRSSHVREQLLQAALKQFAAKGYAGTSIQDIVGNAGVAKPTLYYYFGSKAGLYRALVSRACDEQLRVLQEAASGENIFAGQLRKLVRATFKFVGEHHDSMRLAFATAFASPEEVPCEARCGQKGWESVEFIQGLMERAQSNGQLRRSFHNRALTMAFCGMMNLHVMAHLLHPEKSLTNRTADELVQIFLRGAAGDEGSCTAGTAWSSGGSNQSADSDEFRRSKKANAQRQSKRRRTPIPDITLS